MNSIIAQIDAITVAAHTIQRGCHCSYDYRCGKCESVVKLQDTLLTLSEEVKGALVKIEQDAERWNLIKTGLFITAPDAFGTIEVIYANAWLDARAEDIYDTLPKTPFPRVRRKLESEDQYALRMSKAKGIVRDITPVVDHAIAVSNALRAEGISPQDATHEQEQHAVTTVLTTI